MNTPDALPAPESAPARPARVTRRTVVKLALVGLAGAAVGVGSTPLMRTLASKTPSKYRNLADEDAALLAEICEQLIPRDDAPGATDTGAVDFIDRQLGRRYRKHLPTYRRGLASFRRTCAQVHGRGFGELTAEQKIAFLQSIEAGSVPKDLWDGPSAPAFFNLVLAHTMQSFYGSPRHGGNRGYASYRMLGVDQPAIAGQNRHPKA